MTGVNRTPGHSAGFPAPTTAASGTVTPGASGSARPAPAQENLPTLRRRTATGHVPGAARPGESQPRTAGLPPRRPSRLPLMIHGLAMRGQEVAFAIVAIRNRTLQLLDAECQLPGLSHLIDSNGHWKTLGELKDVSRELTAAGHPNIVSSLIDNVMTLIAGRRIGGAETSAAAERQAAQHTAPAHSAQANAGAAGPSAPVFRIPARFAVDATGEPAPHEPPREAARELIEIPKGLDVSQLDDEWWEQPPPEGPAH